MPRNTQTVPLRDAIPCPLRAAIGITLGLATALVVTRAAVWLVQTWTTAEVREDLGVPLLLLTVMTFVGTLGVMGSVVQNSTRLRVFFRWCADEQD